MATRYGKCTNLGNCDNADNKIVIEIFDGQDFVCPEPQCQQELIEIFNKKTAIPLKKIMIPVSIIIVFGGIIWGIFSYMNFQKNKIKNVVETVKAVVDSSKIGPTVNSAVETVQQLIKDADLMLSNKDYGKAKQLYQKILALDPSNELATNQLRIVEKLLLPPPPPRKIYKKLTFDVGYYEGYTLNNLREGQGIMYFTKRSIINPNDPKKRFAEVGDYVDGIWVEGNIVNGKLFGKNKEQKEALLIGR